MNGQPVDLSFLSIGVSRVKLYSVTDAQLSDATGFFVRRAPRTFFVTAWHVVSGRNFHSKKPLHSSGALPSYLSLTFWGAKFAAGSVTEAEFGLLNDCIRLDSLEEIAENPRNLHPKFGSNVDVIAIDITPLADEVKRTCGFEIIGIEIMNEGGLRPISVMDQVFIPGYPVISTPKPNDLPIYKSGTIASEPLVFKSIPSVFIDGKTKKGWSSSPVIRKIPVHRPPLGENILLEFEQFVLYAIYSGRDEHDPELFSAELAYCWPIRECLVPILESLEKA